MLRSWTLAFAALLVVGLPCAPAWAAEAAPASSGPDSFAPVYRVLTHPRCLNCHTSTDFPRQGDERRRHDFLVQRGDDGRGVPGMRCTTCHIDRNNGRFPGAPHWGLAPRSMAWEGLDASQLCRRLKDPQQNGHRDTAQLIDHMSNDALVAWGWAPGGTRRPVDTPKEAFIESLKTWAGEGAPCPAPATAATAGYELRELRDGLYWLSDGAYNTMFLVSSKGVIAVDPLPTLGRRYLDAIRSVTDKPVTHVVYSHEHIDHIGAASLFPNGAVIVAQKETAQALKRRADPRRSPPTAVFDKDYTLTVGDQTLQLSHKGTNHSPGNLFIYAPKQKVLMLVDVVYPGYMPYPQLGVAADIPGYVQAHKDALAYDFSDFVGGHVDRLGTRADVEASLAFVEELRAAAEASVSSLSFPAFLQARTGAKEPTWFAHDDYEKDRVEACYRSLADRWAPRLKGTDRFLRSHCWAMIVGLAIDLSPAPQKPTPALAR